MIFYKVTHKYKLDDHFEQKDIGIYSFEQDARKAVEGLKQKPGFCDTQDGFMIKRVFRLFKPRLADKTFWCDGFDTYVY